MLLAKPFMKVLVVLIGMLFTLKFLNFDISHMLTGISIGGIGFALASQDTIKNFFGTLTIFIDQPFGVGDTITTGNIKGIVEERGLRATRIRTDYQSVIYIPNAKLADTYIDNHGLQRHQHLDVHIVIAHDTTPNLIETFLEGLRKIATRHTCIWQDEYVIHLEGVHDATLKILLRVCLDGSNQNNALQYHYKVLRKITKLAEALAIQLVSLT
jgi:MscS family membrane protein